MTDEKPRYEEFRVSGDELLAKAKELVHEGNVRRLIIKNESGQAVIEVPLTVGVVAAAVAAPFVAIGAIAALATRHTIVVERTADGGRPPDEGDGPPVENG
jgi:Flp pilus assembly pilin Flp